MRMTLAVLALAAVAGCATSPPAAPAPAASHAQASGTTSTLYDVGCLTASRCFAVGDAGTLLATANGGRTWSREASPTGAPLYRIACAPPASCYVIARPGTILVTHDAGAHWAARALPVHVPGLALPGCEIGDGKAPQLDSTCRLGLLDISCPSARTCYAVATAPGGYDTDPVSQAPGAGPGSSLWLTQDGGATWTRQPIPPGVACDGDCSQSQRYGYPLEWVSCAPSGPCWAGGNQLIGSHEGFAAAWLVTPAPGGSWRLEPDCPPGVCSEPVTDVGACPAGTGCYAVDYSNPFGDGSSTVSIYTATGQNGPNVTVPTGLVINDIACPAARTCYTAGAGGVILRTTNGSTFTPVKTPARENLDGITCVTASDCYAVGAAGIIEALHEG
ncbi:MAG TPA: YCF48-related protein [Streptosporangiaceae bacterium]|nr:YCF48-related protein [Streptosporangiaceae bacterium]